MQNYQELYLFLFNGITDVTAKMDQELASGADCGKLEEFLVQLRQLQLDAEEKFIGE